MQETFIPQVLAASPTEKKTDEQPIPEETLLSLEEYRARFQRQLSLGQSRKERIEKLMIRHSAGRLSEEKRQRMVRRHLAATAQADEAERMLDQVKFRLRQLKTQA